MVGFFIKASLLLSWQRWIPMATCLLVNMSLNQPLLDLLDLLVDCFKAGLDHLGPWLKVLTMAQKVFNTMKVTRINIIIIHAHEAVPKCAKWLFNPQSLVGRKSHETKQFHTASQRILIPQQKQVTRRQMPLLGLVSTLAKHKVPGLKQIAHARPYWKALISSTMDVRWWKFSESPMVS